MSRDILAPPLLRVGKRCYRVNEVHDDFGGKQKARSHKEYVEEDLYADDDDEETFEVQELPNAIFKTTFHVPQAFYGGLIGHKGATKRRIESETHTEIHIPRQREAEDVRIKGNSRSNVCAARRKINMVTISLRRRMRPTHFTCVPACCNGVKEKYIDFKAKILAENYPGIEEELFISPERIHLTLGTCVLVDNNDRAKAVEVLQSCKKFLIDVKTPIEIKICGLEIMNDDPSAVRILYARVESSDLQNFANSTVGLFQEKKLGMENVQNVKLHMTIMNNRKRKDLNQNCADSFDAREILKKYGDFDFGKLQASEIQLCALHQPKSNEFYKSTGVLNFDK